MKIYVLENSWVILAEEVQEADHHYNVNHAYVVRRWGTNAGIGQLAREGIRENTILDAQPATRIPKSAITFIIDCEDFITPEYITSKLVDSKIK